MIERPASLTIIGGLALFLGITGIYNIHHLSATAPGGVELEQMHISLLSRQIMGWVTVIVDLACATGIYVGQPWARVLFFGWTLLGLFVGTVVTPDVSVIVVTSVLLLATGYFLFNSNADRWFGANGVELVRK